MGLIRLWIERFLRGQIGYESDRAFWVLAGLLLVGALAVAVLRTTGLLLGGGTLVLGLLLTLRVRRGLPLLLVGAILVAAWLLIGMFKASSLIPPVPSAGWGGAGTGYDYVAEPRYLPKPKICSDYANERGVLIDEQAGKLTKSDKLWLDMDGDGRYCEERGVAWKGERTHAE